MKTQLAAPQVLVLANVSIRSRLAARGVSAWAEDGESAETFQQRLETALMALFRDDGDEAAFDALYQHSKAALLAWVMGLSGARQRAIDPLEVLQDTFVNIYRYAGGFRDEETRSFRLWSRTIAGNALRRARAVGGPGPRLVALPEEGFEPVDRRASPSEELVRGEDDRQLAQAWMLLLLAYAQAYEKLAQRDRLALELIEVEELSYAEAGVRLAVGMSNMKMIMFRARRRIRAHIAGQLEALRPQDVSPRLAG